MGQLSDNSRVGDARALDETLDALRLDPSPGMRETLLRYCGELLTWNRRTNLTGASGVQALVRGPLFDALTLMPVLADHSTFVDVGSGGGLPGIPATILRPKLKVTLVEPRAKRVTFLKHIVHMLSLDAPVVQGRDGDLKPSNWDGAVAQAVWGPQEWISRAPRLVRPGGFFYVLTVDPPEGSLPHNVLMDETIQTQRPVDGARRTSCRLRVVDK